MKRSLALGLLMSLTCWVWAYAAPKLGDKQIDRPAAMTGYFCPDGNISFVADGPEALVRFNADIYQFGNIGAYEQAIDNVTLVKKSVYDANLIDVADMCSPCSTGIAMGAGFQALDVASLSPSELLYYETFDAQIPSEWLLNPWGYYEQDTGPDPLDHESAPWEILNDGNCDPFGGSLGLGTDGDPSGVQATAEITFYGLEAGEEYVVAFWWRSFSGSGHMQLEVFGTPFWVNATPTPLILFSDLEGASWGDADQDGNLEVYLPRHAAANGLFEYTGSSFVDVASGPAATTVNTNMGLWGDYDGDGLPDIYLVNPGVRNDLLFGDGAGGFTENTPITLESLDGISALSIDIENDGDLDIYLCALGDNRLYRNDGVGAWTETGFGTDAAEPLTTNAAEAADYDGDGDQDLYLAVSFGRNVLLENNGGVFTDVTPPLLWGSAAYQTTDVAWGDYDNDGDPDLYVVNYNNENFLYRNDGGGVFTDVTTLRLSDVGDSYSALWFDAENDGDLDLFVVHESNGNKLLMNNPGRDWVNGASDPLPDGGNLLTAAAADYNCDGRMDLFVTHTNSQPGKVFENVYDYGGNWLQVDLVGVSSNTKGIGAKIEIYIQGDMQMREVRAGNGFMSQSSSTAHFGLGDATSIGTLRVTWPSGIIQDLHQVAANQKLTITEQATSLSVPDGAGAANFRLLAVPNPMRSSATLQFDLEQAGHASLRIFNIRGQQVRELADGPMRSGRHEVPWNRMDDHGRALPSGVYLFRLDTVGQSQQGKLILLDR
ncbi:MAG: T9SS type A sorting domain-containing protein [Candidatus Eisenbacteria bacterium]|uniref:T9SS type A sorting domain-containing protein n=1 Tax=Eiseniibacteriota bacterium TaxID=2212470 RepID=A0A7Y2H3J2_UNCEI|nr:T9SS type A sorting domain-containing protein [Candidatus Eisenbacteria bacterium]